MNSLSALEMKINIQSKSMAQKLFERGISEQANAPPNKLKIPDYRLGEAVHHERYGAGQVMAHLPDGRLQIRFAGVRKSQMIFPSFINRA